MNYFLLIKQSDTGKNEFEIPLFPQPPDENGEKMPIDDDGGHLLNSKKEYRFAIKESGKVVSFQKIRVLVNSAVPYLAGEDYFPFDEDGIGKKAPEDDGWLDVGRIFEDLWCFVQIHITLEPKGTESQELYSNYLRIESKHIHFEDFLEMADFVYQNVPELLVSNGALRSKVETDLRRTSASTLDLRLQLIRKIITVYQKECSFFRSNARVKTEKEYTVDDTSHLQQLSAETLFYITQHSEQLEKIDSSQGIQIGRGTYMPRRTLMVKNTFSTDTYENRAVLNFLSLLLNELRTIEKEIIDALSSLENTESNFVFLGKSEYVSKVFLEKEKDSTIPELKKKLNALILRYEAIFEIPSRKVMHCPKPTAIFCSVPQYREIFDLITSWYRGVFDFFRDRFLLQCIGSSKLYESYVLSCFYRYFKENGYRIKPYFTDWGTNPVTKKPIRNTYCFSKENITVTLFYEPIIRNENAKDENYNMLPMSCKKEEKCYTPDYVLKIKKDDVDTRYVICDAKFSDYETTRQSRYPEAFRKYYEGISYGSDNKAPLCIVYGEYREGDPNRTLFGETRFYPGKANPKSIPNAAILPLAPTISRSSNEAWEKIKETVCNIVEWKAFEQSETADS